MKDPNAPMIPLKYFGAYYDYSGYGEANRNIIRALHEVGAPMTTEPIRFATDDSVDLGENLAIAKSYENRRTDYRCKIMHITPDLYQKNMEVGKYHIGHLFWETDLLPDVWKWNCDLMNEIWTDSEQTILWIGKTVMNPKFVEFPQPIDTSKERVDGYDFFKNEYVFYSIFEWKERKNPHALLTAYLKEFTNVEDVVLVIKTFQNDYSETARNVILQDIKAVKDSLNLKRYPKLFVINQLMDKEEIWKLHCTGDCFVSAHRGEGWGLPQVEAMLAGNPIISTKRGGVHNYLSDKEAFLIDYDVVEIDKIYDKYYGPRQKWAEIKIPLLRKAMRSAYTHQNKAKRMGKTAQQFVKDNFSYETVGLKMKNRLQDIEKWFFKKSL